MMCREITYDITGRERMEDPGRLKYRGGAVIGLFGASWPFATLTAEKGMLTLRCLWTFRFNASQVVALEPCGNIPFFASGIRIVHNDPTAPGNLVFWCCGRRDQKLAAVAALLKEGGVHVDPHPQPRMKRWKVAGVVAVVGLIVSSLWFTARYSDSYDMALEAMYSSPEVERSLGQDKSALLIGHRSRTSGEKQCDDFRFFAQGDKDLGMVRVRTETHGGNDWRVTGVVLGGYRYFPRGCWEEE